MNTEWRGHRASGAQVTRNEARKGICDVEDEHLHTLGPTCVNWRDPGRRASEPLKPLPRWFWAAVLGFWLLWILTAVFGR